MGRDELKSAAEPGGFIEYGKEQLPKVDSMRRDKSQPDFFGIPILQDDQVLFTTAEELGHKPASCYTCKERNANGTCERLGPEILVNKVVGSKKSGDLIEYWPCCSMHEFTPDPRSGKAEYHDVLDTPCSIGLIWINAPKVGAKFGGANCGGVDGGDDCDHYMVPRGDKWENPQGACRVLQHTVNAGDVCTAWRDDDILEWTDAQQLLRAKSGEGPTVEDVVKRKFVRDILKKDP